MIQPTAKAIPSLQEIQANPIIALVGKDRGEIALAFDISGSCCGWCVGQDSNLERYGKLIFKSTAETGEKLVAFGELVDVLLSTFRPHLVLLENPLSSHAKVTARHFELVGILRAAVYAHLNLELQKEHFVAPVTIKKWMAVVKGVNHNDNKRIMVNTVNELCHLDLQYDEKSKNYTDDDVADAIATMVTFYRRAGSSQDVLPRSKRSRR